MLIKDQTSRPDPLVALRPVRRLQNSFLSGLFYPITHLLAGAVDALDEDAFDVAGFGGAGDPDDVGVVVETEQGVTDGAVNGGVVDHRDV